MASNVRYNNFIERTRAQNSSLQSYTDYLKRDSESRSKLRFEVQNDKFIDNKMEQKQRDLLKQQKENFLDIRRKKLSDLLLQEDRNYHKEIIDSQDTPENQRRKMEKKEGEKKDKKNNGYGQRIPIFVEPYYFMGIYTLPYIESEWPESIERKNVKFDLIEILKKSTN